jgi:hypothetical protein
MDEVLDLGFSGVSIEDVRAKFLTIKELRLL